MLNPVSMSITVTGVEAMGIPNANLKDAILNTGKIIIEEGETSVINITNLSELGNLENITYSSSDDAIVTVDFIGKVTGVSKGNAVITLTEENGSSITVDVEVLRKKENNYEELSEGIHITYYETLKEALDNASSESTIKVLKDITDSSTDIPTLASGITATIDLNGHTVTMNNQVKNYGILTIKDSGQTGKILATNSDTIGSYGTVTMEGGTIKSEKGAGISLRNGTATITGGRVEGERFGIWISTNSPILTIGNNNDEKVSTTSPVIVANVNGIEQGADGAGAVGIINFYDGVVQGIQSFKVLTTVNTPLGYDVLKTTSNGIETATLSSAYTLTLDPKGGIIPETSGWTISTNDDSKQSASKTVTYGAEYGTLPTPTRTGYTFAGWYNATSLSDITISANSTDPNSYKALEYNIKPGVTYTITIENAKLTTGTSTHFTTLIYDMTDLARITENVNTSFGANKTVTLTCPSTANGSHKLQILLYAGVQGNTYSNAVKFENIKIGTMGTTTQTQYTSSSTVNTASNHVLYAQWIAHSGTVSTHSKIVEYGKLTIPTIEGYTSRKRYN